MLQPKRTKLHKQMAGHNRDLAHHDSKVSFGEYTLRAISRSRLTARQIESACHALIRRAKRDGKIRIHVFPGKPVTKKPLEVRMGKGKGEVEYWVAQIQPSKVLYEIEDVSEELTREAFALATTKLPFVTSSVERTVMW